MSALDQILLIPGIGRRSNIVDQIRQIVFKEGDFGGMWLPFIQESVFSDTGTTVITEGGTVQQLNDLSGNNLHFTQATSGTRPTWSTGEIVADGTKAMTTGTADFSGSNRVTMICLMRRTGTSSGFVMALGGNEINTFSFFSPSTATNNHVFRSRGAFSSDAVTPSEYPSPEGPAMFVGIGGNGLRTYLTRNDIPVVFATPTNPPDSWISAALTFFERSGTNKFAGEIQALIIVDRGLQDFEIESVSRLLTGKTGIGLNRPKIVPTRSRDSMFSWWTQPLIAETPTGTWVAFTNNAGEIALRNLDTGDTEVLATQSKDDHMAPAILHVAGKMPLAFWHSRPGTKLFWKKGTLSGDFTTLGTTSEKETTGATQFRYTRAISVPGTDDIYVFGRRDSSRWAFFKSTDYGDTFADHVDFFNIQTTGQAYISFAEMGGGNVRCAFYTHPTSAAAIQAIYYCEINLATGAITKADGTSIGNMSTDLPLTLSDLEKVFDAADESDVNTVRMYEVGTGPVPQITFATWDDTLTEADREYRYVYWNGSNWVMRFVAMTGERFGYTEPIGYHGGIAIPHGSNGHQFIVSRESSGDWILERYESSDQGQNFAIKEIKRSKATKLVRPYTAPGKNKLMFVEAYGYGDSFSVWQSDLIVCQNDLR